AGALILREGDHITDVRGSRQHHGQAVQTEGDAAVRWSAELQRVEQETETAMRLLLAHAEYGEQSLLHDGIVNTDAAAAALVAVDDQVIRLGQHAARIALQLVEIFVARSGEWMMVRRPAFFLFIPDERREIDHPGDLEHLRRRIVELELRRQ